MSKNSIETIGSSKEKFYSQLSTKLTDPSTSYLCNLYVIFLCHIYKESMLFVGGIENGKLQLILVSQIKSKIVLKSKKKKKKK